MIGVFLRNFDGGGAELVAVTQANYLHDQGHDVTLYVVSEEGPNRSRVAPGVEVRTLHVERLRQVPSALRTQLRKDRPAVLISHMTQENIVCASAVRDTDVPLICFEHNDTAEIRSRGGLNAFVTWYLMRRAYRRIAHLCCVSRGVAEAFRPLVGATPVSVIYNPISLVPTVTRPDAEPPYLIMVGRLTRQKNYSRALRLFYQMRSEGYGGELRIFGTGMARAMLEDEARDLGIAVHIRFMGYQTNLTHHYAGAEGLLLTSDWEGFGNVLVEALNHGRHVISVDCPHGPAEILGDGAYGLLLPREEDALRDARAVLNRLARPAEAKALKARAQDFNPENTLPPLLDLIAKIANVSTTKPC